MHRSDDLPPTRLAVSWGERLRAIRFVGRNPKQTRKRQAFEYLLSLAPFYFRSDKRLADPGKVFVMRANDLGDLLVITPLFEALRELYPRAEIIVGVGSWSADLLLGNPYVNQIVTLNVPWANKFVAGRGFLGAMRHAWDSEDTRNMRALNCELGIDVYGTQIGMMMLLRAGVPFRLSVVRPGGGFAAAQGFIRESWDEHVGRNALRFAEWLGASNLPPVRPQLYLTPAELRAGVDRWKPLRVGPSGRCVVFPGAGVEEKSWPPEMLADLLSRLTATVNHEVLVLGGKADRPRAEVIAAAVPETKILAGELSLRESAAVVAAADAVLSPSSFGMHLAGAFHKPCLCTLTRWRLLPSSAEHQRLWGYSEQRHIKLGEQSNEDLIGLGVRFLQDSLRRAGSIHDSATL